MSKKDALWLRWLWLASCLVGGLLGACDMPPLKVEAAGCRSVRAGAVCEVARDRDGSLDELRILARTDHDAIISVLQGLRSLPVTLKRTDEGYVVRVRPQAGVTSLSVFVRRGPNWNRQVVNVREWSASDWVQKAYRTWVFENNSYEASRAIGEHLQGQSIEPLRLDDKAWATAFLARIAIDDNQILKGKDLLNRAIELDQQAQLVADEFRDSFRLADVLAKHEFRFEEARQTLKGLDNRPPEKDDISRRSWLELNFGTLALAEGRPNTAVEHAERGTVWAKRFDDLTALRELRALQAEALQSMGKTRDASQLFQMLVAEEPSPCRRAELLMKQGRVQRLAVEGGLLMDELVLLTPLKEALRIFEAPGENGCDKRRLRLFALHELAYAQFVLKHYSDTLGLLGKLTYELSKDTKEGINKELEQQVMYLRGQLMLHSNEFDQALVIFQKITEKADRLDSKSFNEAQWQALIGTAEVLRAKNQKEEALEICKAADTALENYSQSLPLGVGRGSFLGRHERGSSLCLELFLELNRKDEAFAWLRRIRVRALLPVLGLLRPLVDSHRKTRYLNQRRDLDRDVAALETAAKAQTVTLRQEYNKHSKELLKLVEELAMPLPDWVNLDFRPLRADELALICHPALEPGWHCLAANPTETRSYRVDRLGKHTDAAQLLGPIADLLSRTRVLRVLPYGDEMRSQTDIHLLSFKRDPASPARPLWESPIDVVYALDLPMERTDGDLKHDQGQAPAQQKALLVVDPQEEYSGLRKAARNVDEALRNGKWKTQLQIGGAETHGSWANKTTGAPSVAVGMQLREKLASVDLFWYMGHAAADRAAGWTSALKTAGEAGLLVTDVLLLQSVPKWAVLIGCETSQSSEETGGAESLGIAQSFAARGAEGVISTSRVVSVVLAETLVEKLAQNGLTASSANLVDALRKSVTELQRTSPDDLGAFRVVVP